MNKDTVLAIGYNIKGTVECTKATFKKKKDDRNR